MSCTNAATDTNNKFHQGSNPSLPTFLVHYGPYMNWGRWNHNTFRIQSLIEYILNEGYSVQLKHDEKEEGSGWVEISLLSKEVEGGGDILVRSEDVLHNRNYYDREEMLEGMASDVIQQVVDQRTATVAKEEKDEKGDAEQSAPSGTIVSSASTSSSSSSSP